MKFRVVAVGKPRAQNIAAAIEDYETRAARYWPLEVREVREEPARSATAEQVREREGERLLAAAGASALVIACDASGALRTSAELAAWMHAERERALRDVAFVIGGAYGLSTVVLEAAALHLSSRARASVARGAALSRGHHRPWRAVPQVSIAIPITTRIRIMLRTTIAMCA